MLEVVLEAESGTFRQRIDLGGGADQTVWFEPRPILLHGTVFVGKSPRPAELLFRSGGVREGLRVTTDDEGSYDTVLFSPVSLVLVELLDRRGTAFTELLSESIRVSGRRDFHLPGNRFEVRVVDARTSAPLPGAEVGASVRGRDGGNAGFEVLADDEGVAQLPPIRTGLLQLSASAAGYLPSPSPLDVEVDDDAGERQFELALEPEGEVERLRLLTSEGAPASGAEVLARGPGGQGIVWTGRASEEGIVELPESAAGGVLWIRHPSSAFLVRSWQGFSAGDAFEVWSLPPRASAPLALLVVDRAGDPVPWARIALSVAGLRLAGEELAWLLEAPAGTGADGYWETRGLPPSSVRVVAWSRFREGPSPDPDHDPAAVAVGFPWTGTVPIEVWD
jgi:hypothetical protein